MRSKLIVSGARPEHFAPALSGPADALCLDLDESVVVSRKAEARGLAGDLLRSGSALGTAKLLVVRCNAPDSGQYREDLEMVLTPALGLLELPGIESAAQLRAALPPITRLEEILGLQRPVRLLVRIATPAALRHAAEIAAADARVAGLQLELGSLFEPHCVDARVHASVHAAQFAVRMAAAEAGVFALDGLSYVEDKAGFAAQARGAQALGFLGKTCADAAQVLRANMIFVPCDAELALARRIVAAARAADDAGHGAVSVDGHLLDLHELRRAHALLASPRGADE